MQKATVVLMMIFTLLVAGSGSAQAKSVYVSDSFEINLRTGATNEYRIIAMLPSGTKLEVLEEGEEWTRVQSPSGKEGWVQSRFITAETPNAIKVDRLQRENAKLKETARSATSKAAELQTEDRELRSELSRTTQELEKLQKQYASLQTDAQDVVNLKNRFQETSGRLDALMAEREELAGENAALRSESRMRWFLTGAGVMGGAWLVGFLMGRIQRRNRRGSLYS